MFSTALFVVGFLAAFHSGDAVITWTAPNTAGDYTTPIAEGSAVSVTFTAATGVAPYVYTIDTQPGSDFKITSGVVSLDTGKSLDYETTQSHVVKVKVVDTTPSTALSATATVTITVTDVNDNTPIFSPTTYTATVADAAAAATSAVTVIANDADGTAANNVITFSIISGSCDKFSNTAGLISVATGQTLTSGTACYVMVVHAVDSATTGKLTGSTTVTVLVGSTTAAQCTSATVVSCNSAAAITASVVTLLVAFLMMLK